MNSQEEETVDFYFFHNYKIKVTSNDKKLVKELIRKARSPLTIRV